MTVWDVDNMLALGWARGLRDSRLIIGVSVCRAESGYNDQATNHVNAPGKEWNGSRDRGLWQINSYFHPNFSDACCYDPACNSEAMWQISSGGTIWTPWATYNGGQWRAFSGNVQRAYTSGSWQRDVKYWQSRVGGHGAPPPHPQGDPPLDSNQKIVKAGDQFHSIGAPVSQAVEAIAGLFR